MIIRIAVYLTIYSYPIFILKKEGELMKRIIQELSIQLAITTLLFFSEKVSKAITRSK